MHLPMPMRWGRVVGGKWPCPSGQSGALCAALSEPTKAGSGTSTQSKTGELPLDILAEELVADRILDHFLLDARKRMGAAEPQRHLD